MKNIQMYVITMLIMMGMATPVSLMACSPGSVTPIGNYVVYDQNSGPTVSYDVYVCVSDECPSQGCNNSPIATLNYSQVGATQTISSSPISLYLPTDLQSYYYFKITILVYRKVNGNVTSTSDYSYADYDSGQQKFTARKTIELYF